MIAILRPDIKRLEAQIAAAREQDPAATDWDIFVDTGLAEIWEMDATYPEERLHIWVSPDDSCGRMTGPGPRLNR